MAKGEHAHIKARRKHVYELRVAGNTMTQIAQILGVTLATAMHDMEVCNRLYRKIHERECADACLLDLLRYDELIKCWWKRSKEDHKAAVLVNKFLERRGSILGYNEAKRLEVVVQDNNPEILKQKLDEILKMQESKENNKEV